jgi:ACS family hexuronate transporter-like MFS transporter
VSTEEALGPAVRSAESADALVSRVGRYRWRICALLFAATTVNYIDRQVLGVLAPELQRSIGWNEIEYGYIVSAFQAAYAIGLLLAGGFIDRVGTRIGYFCSVSIWSLAAMAHALVRTPLTFGAARFMLGLGEAGNFPACLKAAAEWFPRKERALAVGFVNAGTNVGAIVAPLTVPWIAVHLGWPYAFLITGLLGVPWLASWWRTYRPPQQHPKISAAELAYISADSPAAASGVPWKRLLSYRQTWAYIVAKFMLDPIWWFFLFWLPKFLNTEHGVSLEQLGLPLVVVYVLSDVGSIVGGWISSSLIKRGLSVNASRKLAMGICALAVTPVFFAGGANSLWKAVLLISMATAGHQGFMTNLFTFPSDIFPAHAVGSAVGIGGFAGAIGGMLAATFTGFLLQATGSYVLIFALASLSYLVALLLLHLLVPRYQTVSLE